MSDARNYALFGSPLSHSLSPAIHQDFAEQMNIKNFHYIKIETLAGNLKQQLKKFREDGGNGANITQPLKEEAFKLCEESSARAKQAQAINTVYWQDNILCGDNTDGEGLVRDLTLNKRLDLCKQKILILGAGGVVKGILSSLIDANVHSITIVNRTLFRARALAKHNHKISISHYDSLTQQSKFSLIINATSLSLTQQVPPLLPEIVQDTQVMDLAYDLEKPTSFLRWAKANGANQGWDGLGMLVEQAALSFEIWFGPKPATQNLLKKMSNTQIW